MSTEEVTSTSDLSAVKDVVKKLTPQETRFVQLYLTGSYTLGEIARIMKVHPKTIYKWKANKHISEAIIETQAFNHDAVSNQLKNLTLKAVRKLEDLIDSPIDGVSLQAVNTVLDRGGHKMKTEIKIDKTITTIEEKFKNLIDVTIPDHMHFLEGDFTEVSEVEEEAILDDDGNNPLEVLDDTTKND